MKVKIGARVFPIRWISKDDPGYADDYGSFHHVTGIEINPKQAPDVMASTLLHECIHAMWHVYTLPEAVTEEDACSRLEGAWLAFIQDNPKVIAAIQATAGGVPMKLLKAKRV